jgi:prepilin-type N-terminal cleavage/methylation domain-containing protein
MKFRQDRGLTAVELIVVIVVVGIGAAVTVPALLRGSRNDRLARCEANLKTLWKIDSDARAMGVTRTPPFPRGNAYWAAIATDPKDILTCPLSGARYRGPAADPATLLPQAPIAADAPGSHGEDEGGNVLLKMGEVRAVRESDGMWRYAGETLAP